MAKGLRERVGKQYKGSQRTRKLTTVNVPWSWRNGSFLSTSLSREPDAVQACAAVRGTESLTQSREVRRETSGPSDSPEGESRRGQEHVGKAGGIRRRLWSRPARPA